MNHKTWRRFVSPFSFFLAAIVVTGAFACSRRDRPFPAEDPTATATTGDAATQTPSSNETIAVDEAWYGFYVDATSYAPGDTIRIYGSAPNSETVFRLVRLDTEWTEAARSEPVTVAPQVSKVGSFIEYPTVSLSGRTAFTLEGWFHPTILGGDAAVVAGQFGMDEAAAAILVLPDGRLAAYVSDSPATDQSLLAIAPAPARFTDWLDSWQHLALSYDGAQVSLYVNGELVAQRAQTGAVAQVSAPFRIGARSEAPGDLTGIVDGRLDSWALWPESLSAADIQARYQRGLDEDDPAPDPAQVDLYLSFEGPYPSIQDSSHNEHVGVAINHGTPVVSGVRENGRAFRLNHDQIVDAGWQVTVELTVPRDADSGMYAVQALLGPNFQPTQEGDRLSVRAVAIRPAENGPRAPIAVVLPTNTWLAYNKWPRKFENYLSGSGITPRSRFPGGPTRAGGNNSGYGEMGDNVSLAFFYGLHRPAETYSPMPTGAAIGGYSVRAPNSMYLVQWLDAQGFDYDVYSDDDFSDGLITAADYRVLMPNSHHEYWSDGMLTSLTQFLNDGGSVAAPAGNIFTWRVVYAPGGVMEVRKYRKAPAYGLADLQSGIDGNIMGSLGSAAVCNPGEDYYGYDSFRALGVVVHLHMPCEGKPFCFGQWGAENTDHWLWQGSGLMDGDLFGTGRGAASGKPTFSVGHESDTWVPGMPLPGLAEGQQPVILGEGTAFDPENPGGRNNGSLTIDIGHGELACSAVTDTAIGTGSTDYKPSFDAGKSGTILYFKHAGGGRVLVIGASATPWALESDAALSGLLNRALMCFAYNKGCGD